VCVCVCVCVCAGGQQVSPGAGAFTDVVRFTSAATGQTVSVRVHYAPAGHAAPRRTAVPIAAAVAAVLLSLTVLWVGPRMNAASTVPTTSVSGYGHGGGGYDGGGGVGAEAMRTPLTTRSTASAHGTPRSPLLSSSATAAAGGGDTFHTSPMSPFQPYSAARGGGGGGGGVSGGGGGGGTGTGGMRTRRAAHAASAAGTGRQAASAWSPTPMSAPRSDQPTRFSFGSPLPYPSFSTDRR
jgi:hypothetical protein